MNNTSALGGENIPFYSTSSYYSIGMSTFEPTMGITSRLEICILLVGGMETLAQRLLFNAVTWLR